MGQLVILGANDEQTTCDRCGRVELRGTVILGEADRVEVGRYGSTCAGYMLDPTGKTRGVLARARRIEEVRRHLISEEFAAARRELKAGDFAGAFFRMIDLQKSRRLREESEKARAKAVLADVLAARKAAA